MPPVELQIAQAAVDWLAFFSLGFIVFVVVEWVTGFFRREK